MVRLHNLTTWWEEFKTIENCIGELTLVQWVVYGIICRSFTIFLELPTPVSFVPPQVMMFSTCRRPSGRLSPPPPVRSYRRKSLEKSDSDSSSSEDSKPKASSSRCSTTTCPHLYIIFPMSALSSSYKTSVSVDFTTCPVCTARPWPTVMTSPTATCLHCYVQFTVNTPRIALVVTDILGL